MPPDNRIWTVTATAVRDSVAVDNENEEITRSLYFGGSGGNRHAVLWDVGDYVYVYKDNTYLGRLAPVSTGEVKTTLSGTLEGNITNGETLSFYLPSRNRNYTGQNGTIGLMSTNYMFQETTYTVTSDQASGSTLSLSNLTFTHPQTYIRIRLTDNDTGERLHPTKVQIFAATEKLIKTKDIDGTTTYFDNENPLTINTVVEDGEYPGEVFVSLYNDNGRNDSYKLKAWVGEDIYVGPTNRALTAISNNGVLGNLPRTMTKTTSSSSLSIAAIADQTFTGYAIEPALTVTDGEDALTLDADYSVAYTGNTNVGEATATITGLADAGTVTTTKYLGTKSATFNIVQATPVIDMSTATMTLVNNATENSATRTPARVYIDNNGNGTWDEGTDYDITALCTVTYSSADSGVATVGETTGVVTAVTPSSTTITVSVAAAPNWTAQTASYTVRVDQEVNGQNTVGDWDNGGTESGKVYAE